jgi:hypothetical protein
MPRASELLLDDMQPPPPKNVVFKCIPNFFSSRCDRVLQKSSDLITVPESSLKFHVKERGSMPPDDHAMTVGLK